METTTFNILLADDDEDDCYLFQEALEELPLAASLKIVNNGEQLIELLTTRSVMLPDVIFLDLNMPRKTGFECLSEIKIHEKLKQLPVIIYSTSMDYQVMNLLYEKGAHYYIRKPSDFEELKNVVHKAIKLLSQNKLQASKENFLINQLKTAF